MPAGNLTGTKRCAHEVLTQNGAQSFRAAGEPCQHALQLAEHAAFTYATSARGLPRGFHVRIFAHVCALGVSLIACALWRV